MTKKALPLDIDRPRIALVGVHAPYNHTPHIQTYYQEFLNLVASLGLVYDEVVFIKLREIHPGTFVTKGKLDELKKMVEEKKIDEIVFSEPLTVMQERNLKDTLHCIVYDRTRLILEIFQKGAVSAEGKTQVAIALLQFNKSRLAGKGIHMSQQSGYIGTRGKGETAKEKERRHIEDSILKLKRDLAQFQQARETQRKRRIINRVPSICLIGYTNAGKSTILNRLTKSDVLTENKLFATLDTTVRELFIEGKKKGVISDTVGFIQLLPPQLIEAFKSTLSELQYADLLMQVVDLSDPNWQEHIKVVNTILQELDVHKDMLYVFNKIDQVENIDAYTGALAVYTPHVLISAKEDKVQELISFLEHWKP